MLGIKLLGLVIIVQVLQQGIDGIVLRLKRDTTNLNAINKELDEDTKEFIAEIEKLSPEDTTGTLFGESVDATPVGKSQVAAKDSSSAIDVSARAANGTLFNDVEVMPKAASGEKPGESVDAASNKTSKVSPKAAKSLASSAEVSPKATNGLSSTAQRSPKAPNDLASIAGVSQKTAIGTHSSEVSSKIAKSNDFGDGLPNEVSKNSTSLKSSPQAENNGYSDGDVSPKDVNDFASNLRDSLKAANDLSSKTDILQRVVKKLSFNEGLSQEIAKNDVLGTEESPKVENLSSNEEITNKSPLTGKNSNVNAQIAPKVKNNAEISPKAVVFELEALKNKNSTGEPLLKARSKDEAVEDDGFYHKPIESDELHSIEIEEAIRREEEAKEIEENRLGGRPSECDETSKTLGCEQKQENEEVVIFQGSSPDAQQVHKVPPKNIIIIPETKTDVINLSIFINPPKKELLDQLKADKLEQNLKGFQQVAVRKNHRKKAIPSTDTVNIDVLDFVMLKELLRGAEIYPNMENGINYEFPCTLSENNRFVCQPKTAKNDKTRHRHGSFPENSLNGKKISADHRRNNIRDPLTGHKSGSKNYGPRYLNYNNGQKVFSEVPEF